MLTLTMLGIYRENDKFGVFGRVCVNDSPVDIAITGPVCLAGWDQVGMGRLVANGGAVYEMTGTVTYEGKSLLKVGRELGWASDLAQEHLGLDCYEAQILFASTFKFNDSPYEGLMALANGANVHDVGSDSSEEDNNYDVGSDSSEEDNDYDEENEDDY